MISRQSLEIGKRKAKKRLSCRYVSVNSEIHKIFFNQSVGKYKKTIGKYKKTTKTCSCSICCSKRNNMWSKKARLSIQERKANELFQEELLMQ